MIPRTAVPPVRGRDPYSRGASAEIGEGPLGHHPVRLLEHSSSKCGTHSSEARAQNPGEAFRLQKDAPGFQNPNLLFPERTTRDNPQVGERRLTPPEASATPSFGLGSGKPLAATRACAVFTPPTTFHVSTHLVSTAASRTSPALMGLKTLNDCHASSSLTFASRTGPAGATSSSSDNS